LRLHWPHYLIEAWGLGTFMFVAGMVAVALSDVHGFAARALFGVAMGTTAATIVYSAWGTRSGAHLNPSLTLTYAWLGKIAPWDAAFYVLAQFAGGALGLGLAVAVAREPLRRAHDIVTQPGPGGPGIAFAAEFAMAFVLMSTVLTVSNAPPRIARFTGVAAAVLVALFITFEAPLSGMSLNPARTFASALHAREWTALWIYFTAPPLGMLAAAALYVRVPGAAPVRCARLHHVPGPCIFRCGYRDSGATVEG
jgi:aquaporin Z